MHISRANIKHWLVVGNVVFVYVDGGDRVRGWAESHVSITRLTCAVRGLTRLFLSPSRSSLVVARPELEINKLSSKKETP